MLQTDRTDIQDRQTTVW